MSNLELSYRPVRARRSRRRAVLAALVLSAASLAAVILLALPAQASAVSFTDVPKTHAYALAITDLAERGVIGGYDDGTFKPESSVLRQHFAKMIVLALGIPVSEADVCTFSDVNKSGADSFYPDNYIAAAFKAGITKGSTDPTKFKPGDQIRRSQLISMVVRAAADYSAVPLQTPDAAYFAGEGKLAGFTDPNHGDNVHKAEFNGLLNGIQLEGWNLNSNATRGEVAQILCNAIRVFQIGAVYVKPDGSGDYATIQAAVAAAPANSVIVLGPGTYVLPARLDITKSLHLVGSGAVKVQCPQTVLRVFTDGVFSAQHIGFEHTGSAPGHGAYVDKGIVDFHDCSFSHAVFDQASGTGGNGLWILGDTAGTIRDCTAYSNGYCGLVASETAHALFVDNECTLNSYHGLSFEGSATGTATGNESYLNDRNGIGVYDTANPKLVANTCESNDWSGVVFASSAGGSAENNRCAENLQNGIWVGYSAQPQLRGNVCKENLQNGIMYVGTSGGTADDNECSENTFNGIRIAESARPALKDNVCNKNSVVGISYAGTSGGTAEGNVCRENTSHGIQLTGSARAELKGNECAKNGSVGIVFAETSSGKAEGNTCAENGFHGIEAQGTAKPELINNVCRQNKQAGILFNESSGGKAQGNQCYGNAWGIYVKATANPVLTGNVCHDNTTADVVDLR